MKIISFPKKLQNWGGFLITIRIMAIFTILLPFKDIAFAQSNKYKIQNEDVLKISFWENPELNSTVTVGNDGGIELPIIGRVTASGLTIEALRNQIISQMGLYDKVINHLSIVVTEYGLNKVFVTGQVTNPGKYSFEEIPNVWEIILEAGGPLQTARLDNLNIIRANEDGKIISIDLSTALESGKLNELPPIYPGDTIHIPGTDSPFDNISAGPGSRNEVQVIGAVGVQGSIMYSQKLNLLIALSKAGGLANNADLKNIKYVEPFKNGTKVVKINLEFYLNNSLSIPVPTVNPGSTVYVPAKKQLSPILVTVITTAVSAAITSIIFVTITR